MTKNPQKPESADQRLDKWLWFARLTKTRTLAAKLIEAGKVRVNKTKITKPAFGVKPEDVITATIHTKLHIVKVLLPGERRGPGPEARLLYEDLTPPEDGLSENVPADRQQISGDKSGSNGKSLKIKPAPAPRRDKGAGRPTKKERRELENFLKGRNE